MKTHSRVIVIGGGVVGCSILYHLTRLGWSDVVLLERKELTAGSTWHAAGGFHTLNGDPNVARLQKYTIDLYHEIEKITGDPVGMHLTGGINLAATDAWWDLLKNEAARHKFMGIESELIGPAEIHNRCPIVDVTGLKGGIYMADEGHIDPYRPVSPDQTAERIEMYLIGEDATNPDMQFERQKLMDMLSKVNNEDIGICEMVQKGRKSETFTGGVFAPVQEQSTLQFQQIVARKMLMAGGKSSEALPQLPIEDIHHPLPRPLNRKTKKSTRYPN